MSQRPIRIWNEDERRNEPHRCYATVESARHMAFKLVDVAEVGNSYTVYDNDTAKWHLTLSRRVNSIYYADKRTSYETN